VGLRVCRVPSFRPVVYKRHTRGILLGADFWALCYLPVLGVQGAFFKDLKRRLPYSQVGKDEAGSWDHRAGPGGAAGDAGAARGEQASGEKSLWLLGEQGSLGLLVRDSWALSQNS